MNLYHSKNSIISIIYSEIGVEWVREDARIETDTNFKSVRIMFKFNELDFDYGDDDDWSTHDACANNVQEENTINCPFDWFGRHRRLWKLKLKSIQLSQPYN